MEGDLDDARENRTLTISIHSLRMEGDSSFLLIDFMVHHFNPLPPYGGRLLRSRLSIDCVINFNPLPPYGGRLCDNIRRDFGISISIHSLRMEGDLRHRPTPLVYLISIHSLRMEGDLCLAATGGNQ